MSFLSDLRGVSESALSQLADRFSDLPRPLLAAIGAGDFTIEQLAELREALMESLEKSTPSAGDVRGLTIGLTTDLPAKLQEAAAEAVESMQKFALELPVQTQHLVAELPDLVKDIREALSPDQLKTALDGYTQLAGIIYGSLADRGGQTWSKVTAAAGHDASVITVAQPAPAPVPAAAAAAEPATPAPAPVAPAEAVVAAEPVAPAEPTAQPVAGAADAPHVDGPPPPIAAPRKSRTPKPVAARPATPVRTTTTTTTGAAAAAPRRRVSKPAPKPAAPSTDTAD